MDEEKWTTQLLTDFNTLVDHGWFNVVYDPYAALHADPPFKALWTIMFYDGIMMQRAEGTTFPEALDVAVKKIALTWHKQ